VRLPTQGRLIFPAYFRISVISDAEGRESGVVWVAMGITERRKSEQQLKMARVYLKAITDSMGQGMCTADEQRRLTYMNQAAEAMLGWSRSCSGATCTRRRTGRRPATSARSSTATHMARWCASRRTYSCARTGARCPSPTPRPRSSSATGEACVVVFEDISERQAQARRSRATWRSSPRSSASATRWTRGFLLYSQPIIELASGASVQRELLIRMRHPEEDRVLSPAYFLPAAEEYGFIDEIDRWVIDRSAELAARGLHVELNISAVSIGDPTRSPRPR
jgi:hypothetical protein